MATSTTTETTVDTVRELVSSAALLHIRPQVLTIKASLLKPNTRMYFYFDGLSIDQYVTPEGGSEGEPVLTDSSGTLTANFNIPENTFSTGDREVMVSDSSTYVSDEVEGFIQVKASTVFSANGTLETYQTTETTTITTTVTKTVTNYDPLAQSFFTYGIKGGCFLTSIDLFFFSKDSTLPAWIEVRELVNGYPGPKLVHPSAISIKNPSDINLSDDASVATNFKFDKLIYLREDADYCFVVRSNASTYNIWTSKLGETANETGYTVFDQPYMGSLFKSENNVTWTAEQTEDIKFIMYRADFDTSSQANLAIKLNPTGIALESSRLETTSGSNIVRINFQNKHGLDINSKVVIAADEAGQFNGINGTDFTGEFNVINVESPFSVDITIPGVSANRTGEIQTGGNILDIIVNDGGSGYDVNDPPEVIITKNDPTITAGSFVTGQTYTIATVGTTNFVAIGAASNSVGEVFEATGPGTGTGTAFFGESAEAVAEIKNGKVNNIRITNKGSGYFIDPTITLNSILGSGASLEPFTAPLFGVYINRIYHIFKPLVKNSIPTGTSVNSILSTTTASYEGGSLANYGNGKDYQIDINKIYEFDSNLLLATSYNETVNLGGNPSTLYNVYLGSTNSNVSPIIDLSESRFQLKTHHINSQRNENINSANSSGTVLSITLTNGGSGYTEVPTVTINGTGTGATATATIDSGSVDTITLTNGGSGYYGPVTVSITGGGVGVTTVATAIVSVSDYNSELLSGKGTADARYITKPQLLQNSSTGIRLYALAYSNIYSNFDVYIKTTSSSSDVDLSSIEWHLLECDRERNKSKFEEDFIEYEFNLTDIEPFDVYLLKFVLRTTTPWDPPRVINYRAIMLA